MTAPMQSVNKRKHTVGNGKVTKKQHRPAISLQQTPEEEKKAKAYFQPKIFQQKYETSLKHQIDTSGPYHWGSISDLFNDELLRNVRKEILENIHFTKKETDIYKVFQSGDLANLSALSEDLKKKLPSLCKVRSGLYSKAFRNVISRVTGCGDLSGSKMDISIHLYNRTCHLLTHDDVIGSRRISYILYMPDPDKEWKPSYGGALRLFDSIVPNVPESDPVAKLTPQFNQIAFFHVQPGVSFHDVEEVTATKQRLSLQGWFHIPQPKDEGYIPGEQERTEAKSTLELLETRELREYDFPKFELSRIPEPVVDQFSLDLKKQDIDYLAKFMNPVLLTQESLDKLQQTFSDSSVVDIVSFLNDSYAGAFRKELKHFELNEYPHMPSKQSEIEFPWKLAIPSHKRRYMYMDGTSQQDITTSASIAKLNETYPHEEPNFELTADMFRMKEQSENRKEIESKADKDATTCNSVSAKLCDLSALFKSIAFGKWLYRVTQLKALRQQILVRRFRPGHDFILATKPDKIESEESFLDGVLEATLNLTPTTGWEAGEWGAYELCMIDETDDKEAKDEGRLNEDEAAIYRSSETDESVVYESQACWNKLCLMFRDSSVMKFVKYISYDAPGSRYDITASWLCKDEDDE